MSGRSGAPPRYDWETIAAAWGYGAVSEREFCESTGVERTWLRERMRREGRQIYRRPTLRKLRKHELAAWRRGDLSESNRLAEEIQKVARLHQDCLDIVRQMIVKAREAKVR